MELKGKKVLVVGCGKSGLGAAQLLIQAGAQPILFDENPDLDAAALRRKEEFLADVPIFLKALPEERIGQLDLVVASPGIPVDSPALGRFFDAGIPVWGEVELAWNCEKGQVAAITGTNGENHHHCAGRGDHEEAFFLGFRGGQYRDGLYGEGASDGPGQRDRGRNQQLPAGDGSLLSSEGFPLF